MNRSNKFKPRVSHVETIELRNPEIVNIPLSEPDAGGGYDGRYDNIIGKFVDGTASVFSSWFGSQKNPDSVTYVTTGNPDTDKKDSTWLYLGIGGVVLVLVIVLVLALRK